MEYQGKRVLVVGLARSGVAAAKLLCREGARVTVNDSKTREALGDALKPLESLPVTWRLGCPAMELLEGQEILVISPGISVNAAFVQRAKELGLQVIGELELADQLCPGEMVAVTGTNGKTTTTTLIYEMVRSTGRGAWAVGNIGFPYSQAVLEGSAEDEYVCEVSSFQMETAVTFHPRAAVLLNITEDHLNRHGTMQEYIRMKMRVFRNQSPEDVAVFNMDDPVLEPLSHQVHSRVMRFSRLREVPCGACLSGGWVVSRWGGQEHRICRPEEIRIPGPHNLENALAAVCVATVIGVPPERMAHALRTFPGVEHRIEFVRELEGVRYINDSKGTNVDSTIRAVQTMDRPTVIILGGSDKHCDFTPLAREMLAAPMLREAVLIGDTAEQIQETLLREGWQRIHRVGSMAEAIRTGRALAAPGWNVLLSPACASFDMFTDYEHRGRVFKELVMALD